MKFLKQLEDKQQQAAAAAYDRYRDLLGKASLAGELSAKDQREFEDVVAAMEYAPERVAADVDVLVRSRDLATRAGDYLARTGEVRAVEAERGRVEEARRAYLAECEAKIEDIARREGSARLAMNLADDARRQLDALRHEHWRLLGMEDPAVVANRRTVAQAIFADTLAGEMGNAVLIENAMAWDSVPTALLEKEFVPMEGQTAEDVARLVGLLQTLADAKRNGVSKAAYLLPDDWRPKVRQVSTAAMFVSEATERELHTIGKTGFRDDGDDHDAFMARYCFIPAPGQTAEEVAALVEKVRAKRLRKHKNQPEPARAMVPYEPAITGRVLA